MNNGLSKLALVGLLAGGASIFSSCGKESVASTTPSNNSLEKKAEFLQKCLTIGADTSKIAQLTCRGTASCKGIILNTDSNFVRETTCQGTNSCNGLQCIAPESMSSSSVKAPVSSSQSMSSSSISSSSSTTQSSMATSSSSQSTDSFKKALLAAKSAEDFKSACESGGKKATSQTCNTHNTCAGIYFHDGSFGTTVGAVESTCQGTNKCSGFKCEV